MLNKHDFATQTIALLAQGHCTKYYARDRQGAPVDYISENACHFCIFGALLRIREEERTRAGLPPNHPVHGPSPEWYDIPADEIFEQLANALRDYLTTRFPGLDGSPVVRFNDSHSQQEVIDTLHAAWNV